MDLTLTAETGRETGSGPSIRLRADGRVPGVVYGLGKPSVTVSVGWPELRSVLTTDAGLNALIRLDVDGEQNLTIVKDLQRDPVRRTVLHVDFLRIDPDAQIEVEVPVVLEGEPETLYREGGLVEQHLHRLAIKAKPGAIPNELTLDITDLTIERSLRVGDIPLPEGVAIDVDPDDLVVAGFIPRAAQAEEEEEELEGVEGVEGEGAAAEAAPAESSEE